MVNIPHNNQMSVYTHTRVGSNPILVATVVMFALHGIS